MHVQKYREMVDIYVDIVWSQQDNHTFECNVCEIRLGNHEELNMHLLTCEIYKCFICDYKNKRLSELKTHIKSKHGDKKVSIQHFKMNKEDFKRKTCTRYSFDDIWIYIDCDILLERSLDKTILSFGSIHAVFAKMW